MTCKCPHCSYWVNALGAYNLTANNLMLTTAEEAEFIKNIEDILEAAYNLQDASEMLFIHQNSSTSVNWHSKPRRSYCMIERSLAWPVAARSHRSTGG